VALPVRNALRYVETCLTSIAAQMYPAAAYLQDDASTDGTFEFLVDRPGWYRTLRRNETRLGWPRTLNAAARLAFDDGCDAVFVANADDFLRLDCVAKAVGMMRVMGHDWVVTTAQQIGAENVVQASKAYATVGDFADYPPLVNYGLYSRRAWETVGGYATDVTLPGSYGFKEDWDFHVRLLRAGFTYGVVSEPVYYYVMHPGQLHKDGATRLRAARRLVHRKHPGLKGSGGTSKGTVPR
jgi:GT2 family glycosyltransferase